MKRSLKKYLNSEKNGIDVRRGLPNNLIHVVNEKIIKVIKQSEIPWEWAFVGFTETSNKKFQPQFEGIVCFRSDLGLTIHDELKNNKPKYLKNKKIIKIKNNPDFDHNDIDSKKEALEEFINQLITDRSDYALSKDGLEEYGQVLLDNVNPVYFNLKDFIENVASDEVEKLYVIYVKRHKLLSDDEFIDLMKENSVIDNYYGITGPKTDELTRVSLGEQQIQLSRISGEVNGKKSNMVIEELMTNLSDKDLNEVARRVNGSWSPTSNWKDLYIDMSYDHAVLLVDEESLKQALIDKYGEEEN